MNPHSSTRAPSTGDSRALGKLFPCWMFRKCLWSHTGAAQSGSPSSCPSTAGSVCASRALHVLPASMGWESHRAAPSLHPSLLQSSQQQLPHIQAFYKTLSLNNKSQRHNCILHYSEILRFYPSLLLKCWAVTHLTSPNDSCNISELLDKTRVHMQPQVPFDLLAPFISFTGP